MKKVATVPFVLFLVVYYTKRCLLLFVQFKKLRDNLSLSF